MDNAALNESADLWNLDRAEVTLVMWDTYNVAPSMQFTNEQGVAFLSTAYEADNPVGTKCGAPDVLAIELLRAEEVPSETLTRSADFDAPVGECG